MDANRYPRYEAPRSTSLRANPCADERTLQVNYGAASAIEIVGYGMSVEVGVTASPSRPEDNGVYFDAKLFFGGVAESVEGLRSLRGATGKFGPSVSVTRGPRPVSLMVEDSFREVQVGPITIAPPTACGDWQVAVSESLGLGGRTGSSYKLNINSGIIRGGLKHSSEYLQRAFDAWNDSLYDEFAIPLFEMETRLKEGWEHQPP